ncbi:MAG: glycosyltransferase family 2 protein [Nitrococcus sp.]|nr:glycosyltransferase family 2 protein [Nitrococcus sp.]
MHARPTNQARPDSAPPRVVISVVSHGHGALIRGLLSDIREHWNPEQLRLVLTQNLHESAPQELERLAFPTRVIRNLRPRGFAANHNAAFGVFESEVFCVVNPDVRCREDPLPALLNALASPEIGLAAPRVVNPEGGLEDSARRCITPLRILRRISGMMRGPDYDIDADPVYPDWVAGMFMALRSETFARLAGFDERYRLYCEDADLCMRLQSNGQHVILAPKASVVHGAQRASHRQLHHLRWHVSSLLRFFVHYPFYRPVRSGVAKEAGLNSYANADWSVIPAKAGIQNRADSALVRRL